MKLLPAVPDYTVNIPKRVFLECYHHLLESKADINFLWGGRDSGKSIFIAQLLVLKCLSAASFRCVLVRKTFNSIQESQYVTIKAVCKSWKVDHLFRFREAPLSIHCINGNGFICRGCDNVDNIKSIDNPTDAWYEEGNQLELDDFIAVATTLRSNEVEVQQWFSFNPEARGDYKEFWLYKTFFADNEDKMYNPNFESTWSVPVGEETIKFTYTSTWTTYKDNRYVKPTRKAFLEQLAILSPYYYKVYTCGFWGNEKVDSPFCYTFIKDKHTGDTKLNRKREVVLSFDFNKNPITCGVIQSDSLHDARVIEAIKLDNSDIYKLCDYILVNYVNCLFLVTGDATGRNSSALVHDNINYYTVIKEKFGLSNNQIKVPTINPVVKENRMLVNASFHTMKIIIDRYKAKHLIYDLENVSVDEVGDIEKGDRKNPKQRADALDWWRYYLNTFHKGILRE